MPMETLLLKGDNPQDIARAGAILRSGGLVAIPTETVYGLAANALDGEAVRRVYQAKGRPSDNPLIVHISEFSQLSPLVRWAPENVRKLAEAFWPGPLTVILPKSGLIPPETSGGLSTVAIRMPAHPAARAVIQAAGVPLAAPSANLSGRPSPTSFSHVREDLFGRVDALLDGGDCGVGVESTVLTLAEGTPRVLRPGGVTVEQLRAVLGDVEVDPAVLHRLEEGRTASSPGMKYRHYAPKANVILTDASPSVYEDYVNQRPDCCALCFDEDIPYLRVPFVSYGDRYDGAAQAHRLFSALHRLDQLGAGTVYARIPSRRGVGLAVYNRLVRAAGFQRIRPQGRLVVGLTGPSGAGKSSVAALLRERGWAVLDCDALTRSPAVYDADCIREIQSAFGEETAPGGVLNRRALAQKAFSLPEQKEKLESIVFPRIRKAVWEETEKLLGKKCKGVILDAPTLFESGLDRDCARILVVTAPREQRLERVCRRDALDPQQAALRFSAQPEDGFYTERADWVVENNRGEAELALAAAPILDALDEDAEGGDL